MRQTKEQGGRRCPSHQPGYLGLKTLIADTYGLNEHQIKHSYDVLRLQGANHPEPTLEEYDKFIQHYEEVLQGSRVSSVTKKRIRRQFGKPLNEDQLPDGASFYAMSHLVSTSNLQKRRINANLQRFSKTRGVSMQEANEKFHEYMDSTVSPRRQRRRGLLDVRSRRAFEQMYRNQEVHKEEFRRVELLPVKGNTMIEAAGYDPEDGRLEVQIAGDIYAFRGVSNTQWEEFERRPMSMFREVKEDESKNYLTAREAEEDAHRIWCDKCKRFRLASGHACAATGNIESVYQEFRSGLEASRSTPVKMPGWYQAWEKRTHVDMGTNPPPAKIRQIANNFDIAEFTLSFTSKDGHKVSGDFRAGRATPRDITLDMMSNLRCDCPDYQENYTCEHTSGQGFYSSVRKYYEKVDEGSADRNRDLRFPYDTYADHGRVTFSCPPEGLTPQMTNDIAYVCQKGHKAMLYLNNKEIRGDGEALGAFTFTQNGTDIDVIEQATCTRCNRQDCNHIRGLSKRFSSSVQQKLLSPEYRLAELDRMDRDKEAELRSQDSTANRFSGARNTPRYSDNISTYISDLREAEQNFKNGHSPLNFVAGSVTNGNISATPGQGRGFGVEIEYVVEDERARYAIQQEIAQTLFSSGLSREGEPFAYGDSSRYTGYREWAVEDDSSVSGEVISPIMYDTPESWNQIAKVCEIIKKHGGRVDETCGQHVHIGVSRTSAATNIGIMQFMQSNQDSLRRAGTNPQRGIHRNNMFSVPVNEESAQGLIYDLKNHVDDPTARDRMVNFQNDGHVEFRDADGTLDPAHIQAQVMIAAAVVAKSERRSLPEVSGASVRTQEVGTNRKRTQLITGGRIKNLSEDELMVSDIAYRATIDALFDDDHSKKTMVALAAMTPWQKGVPR